MILSKSYKKSMDNIVISDDLKKKIIKNTSDNIKNYKKFDIKKYSVMAACMFMAICSVYIGHYLNYYNPIPEDINNISVTEENTEISTNLYIENVETNSHTEIVTESQTKNKIEKKNINNPENINELSSMDKTSENNKKQPVKEIKTENATSIEEITEITTIFIEYTDNKSIFKSDLNNNTISKSTVEDNGYLADTNSFDQNYEEEKIIVKEPVKKEKFNYQANTDYNINSGGGNAVAARKKSLTANDIPYSNMIVEPTYVTKYQYDEMLKDIEKLVDFKFKAFPYDENAAVCVAIENNIVIIQYIYNENEYINLRIAKGSTDARPSDNLINIKYEKTDYIDNTVYNYNINGNSKDYYAAYKKSEPVSFSIISSFALEKDKIIKLANSLS